MSDALTEACLNFLSEIATMVTTMAIAQIGWYLAAGVAIGVVVFALFFWATSLAFRAMKWGATWCFRQIRRTATPPVDPTSA